MAMTITHVYARTPSCNAITYHVTGSMTLDEARDQLEVGGVIVESVEVVEKP